MLTTRNNNKKFGLSLRGLRYLELQSGVKYASVHATAREQRTSMFPMWQLSLHIKMGYDQR